MPCNSAFYRKSPAHFDAGDFCKGVMLYVARCWIICMVQDETTVQDKPMVLDKRVMPDNRVTLGEEKSEAES
jgi:hypothetical protein